MIFISLLSIYLTTIFCTTESEIREDEVKAEEGKKKEWDAQLANVFIDVGSKKTFILVDNEAFDYSRSEPKSRDFSTADFTEEGLRSMNETMIKHTESKIDFSENPADFLENDTTFDIDKQTIYSFKFEPITFIKYDFKENPTLKCLVNIWPDFEKGKTQFNDIAHVELKFESETENTVNWKVVKMTRNPLNRCLDDEFKHFDVMTFKKAVYNLSSFDVKNAEWGFDAFKGEVDKSEKVEKVEKIDYNGTFIFTFDELNTKKVKWIAFKSSHFPAGDLNVANFIEKNKKKV